MEKLEKHGNVILWTIDTNKWLISFDELTKAYISGKHPHTQRCLSTASQNKLLLMIRKFTGNWWVSTLKKIKNYKPRLLSQLQKLKLKGHRLGNGKYATVYELTNYAVKVVNHRFYKGLPRIDGKLEAKIMMLLQNRITYCGISPNIITMYQYLPDKKTDYIVMEKLDKTLWSYLQVPVKDRLIKGILLQIMFTLAVIQYTLPNFRHNDLKVDNLLLDLSKRAQSITLRYKKYFWDLPTDIPLIKIADFDYASHPKCVNCKVGTEYAQTFGCTVEKSKIYDTHLFLNSLYNHRNNLGSTVSTWLQKQLPSKTRGNNNDAVKFGRLCRPEKWTTSIRTPLQILQSNFLSEFRTINPSYPLWGIS